MPRITRRLSLAGGAALLAGGAAPPYPEPRSPGLHSRAEAKGMFFGTAVDHVLFHEDPAYMARVQAECGMLVGENVFKWEFVQPAPDKFTFEEADALMAYAARHRLRARGHTLVWHGAMPDWLKADLSPATGERLLTTHIGTVTRHFRHRLVQWDVPETRCWSRTTATRSRCAPPPGSRRSAPATSTSPSTPAPRAIPRPSGCSTSSASTT